MRLYAIAPNADLVAKHFERMAKGELTGSRDQYTGYGFLGSKSRVGTYTQMSGGAQTKEPLTVRGMTGSEVAVAQAKSQLDAESNLFKKQTGKKPVTKKIKAKRGKGKAQSKPSQRGGRKSVKGKALGKKKTKAKKSKPALKGRGKTGKAGKSVKKTGIKKKSGKKKAVKKRVLKADNFS
jgi:hypothetical protein